ncbi:hypothetical protein I350_04959 [Cryptococcus amylolentus CBS 6273]|uniref:DH domain-containing protein n=1 Tax=Cryptococcus amylolentus CBS 6273 TaxID=1296118 RepID=A0A1E3JYE3_9TREE|nr:hypothetical protein I350_04959 [Cryptococcus amylolentus CBS 6273]
MGDNPPRSLPLPPGASHPLPRVPSPAPSQLSKFASVNGTANGLYGSTSRRPLPQPSPSKSSLTPSRYPNHHQGDTEAPRSVSGRRALPTPPAVSNGVGPRSDEAPRSRALPTPPSGPPPPPPPRPPSDHTYMDTRAKPPLPVQPDRAAALRSGGSSSSMSTGQSYRPEFERSSIYTSEYAPSDYSRDAGTLPSSVSSHTAAKPPLPKVSIDNADKEWLPILERFDIPSGEGTLHAPSAAKDPNSGPGTPTQRDWESDYFQQPSGGRDRAASAVTMKAGDDSIYGPLTPRNDDASSVPSVATPGNASQAMNELRQQDSLKHVETPDSGPSSSSPSVRHVPDPPHRQSSSTSSLHHSIASARSQQSQFALSPSWTQQTQTPSHWVERKLQIHASHRNSGRSFDDGLEEGPSGGWEEDEWEEGEEEGEEDVDEGRFFQPAFLSEMALQLRDRVERRRHIKSGIAWVGSFTGKDIVTAIQSMLPSHTREGPNDRRFALTLAQSLQNQLWFVEVDWDIKPLRDSPDDVFRFMGEMEGMGSGGDALTTELPKGLMTMATRCYAPSCSGDGRCYAPRCPYRTGPNAFLPRKEDTTPLPTPASSIRGVDWKEDLDPITLHGLSPQEITRQDVIRQALASEVAYQADLEAMETLYVNHLRTAEPPIIKDPMDRENFIQDVFHNAGQLREASAALIEEFTIRVREQPVIRFVGDLFLQAATEFRNIYPEYTGKLPQAEATLSKELEENPELRLYIDQVVRENDRRRDLKHLLTRPSSQLQRYPALLEGILNVTNPEDADYDFLSQALQSIQSIMSLSQLKLFHASKGRGPAAKIMWFDLVGEEARAEMPKKEQKRQMHIWELVQGEMEYVADLEAIETLFVDGLRTAEPAVIDRNRLDVFLDEAFHNYRSLLEVHSRLLHNLQQRQLEQHPNVGMISDLVFDAALNWQEAYMEYVTHYPIAKAKVQEEEHKNPKFAAFLKACLKDPASNRQDVYHFINRPIPRLLRYNLLLADILKCLKETKPADDSDIDQIPQVMEVIADLGKATQKGVAVNEAKVELWGFQKTLDGGRFGRKMVDDLDLVNPMRELIHKGKVYRQPEGSITSGWTELSVLLFDHYLVITKEERQSRASRSSKKDQRQVRSIVNRRPIPLELLSLGSFGDPPRTQRMAGRLFGVGGASHNDASADGSGTDTSKLYPFSISFIGGQERLGGSYTLWTDSYAARQEWQEKLQHAKVLRNEVDDAGKVFEMNPLSVDTFYMPPSYALQKDKEKEFTGRVTCSCPFTTQDGRRLTAVGCQDGVWIGLRGDARSLRKVLHVKAVTNIAVLEDFHVFLVLSDKAVVAYQLEALVPSAGQKPVKSTTERISGPKEEISAFVVGKMADESTNTTRMLVVMMKIEATQTVFKVMEPVAKETVEDAARQRRPFGFSLSAKSDWFRSYKMFYLPAETYGVHFLKKQLAIVCSKGFEIMDLGNLKGGPIPMFDAAKVKEKPALAELESRCSKGRPMGMFRSTETEFLLCYDTFGVFIYRYGEPNRDYRAIEWEGKHDSVAFHPPYILLISAPFIEVRHVNTGKLLQIYTGSDMRLTWDGSGGQRNTPILKPDKYGYGDETKIQEPQIHIACRASDQKSGKGGQPIGQVVYELSPTLLLNNPLMNPFNTHDSNYLPPPPLTSHVTPQIRQARPPSVRTTYSVDQAHNAHGVYQNANPSGFIGFPNATSYAGHPPLQQRPSSLVHRESYHSRDSMSYPESGSYGYGASPQDSAGQFHQSQQSLGVYSSERNHGGGYGGHGQQYSHEYGQHGQQYTQQPAYPGGQASLGPGVPPPQVPQAPQGYGGGYNDIAIRAWAQGGDYRGSNGGYERGY